MDNKRDIYEYMAKVASKESISHHGIKGQKWGRRRFQNEDGSLTVAGKQRYLDSNNDDERDNDNKSKGPTKIERRSNDITLDKSEFRDISDNKSSGLVPVAGKRNPSAAKTDDVDFDPIKRTSATPKAINTKKPAESNDVDFDPIKRTSATPKAIDTKKSAESNDVDFDPIKRTSATPKAIDTKKSEPKKEDPDKSAEAKSKAEKEANAKKRETEPKKDTPKNDEPKKDTPKKDEPKKDAPKNDEPKKDAPKKDEPKKDAKTTVENLRKAADKQKFEDQINAMQSTRNVLDSSAKLSKNLKDASDESIKNAPKVRLNLDDMSDAQLRQLINREQLERQYNDYFAPSTVTKGQRTVNQMLGAITTGLTVAGSALSVAIAIRQLLNK